MYIDDDKEGSMTLSLPTQLSRPSSAFLREEKDREEKEKVYICI
jgi:hypothetical protein